MPQSQLLYNLLSMLPECWPICFPVTLLTGELETSMFSFGNFYRLFSFFFYFDI